MKRNFLLSLLMIIFLCSFLPLQTKKRILFFGDSITQQGAGPKGYVTLVDQKLKEKAGGAYEAIGAGISGNKIYDLYLRMDDDVLAKKPDAVVIWIGVNDVWSKVKRGTGTDPDRFTAFYNAIIKKLQKGGITVFLATPAVIGEKTDGSNEQEGDMNKYAALVRSIAKNNHCSLIDLRKAFLEYNLQHNTENKESGVLTVDGVHLNDTGNQLVAEEMYRGLSKDFIKEGK
jgi:lysophospholipase L1-like esterase